MTEVDTRALQDELASRPKWMALSERRAGLPLDEPNLEDGYVRLPIVEGDWTEGRIDAMRFGPARSDWTVESVALLNASGTPLLWVPVDPPAQVLAGQVFTYELTVTPV